MVNGYTWKGGNAYFTDAIWSDGLGDKPPTISDYSTIDTGGSHTLGDAP